jgi:hypothetical protein
MVAHQVKEKVIIIGSVAIAKHLYKKLRIINLR